VPLTGSLGPERDLPARQRRLLQMRAPLGSHPSAFRPTVGKTRQVDCVTRLGRRFCAHVVGPPRVRRSGWLKHPDTVPYLTDRVRRVPTGRSALARQRTCHLLRRRSSWRRPVLRRGAHDTHWGIIGGGWARRSSSSIRTVYTARYASPSCGTTISSTPRPPNPCRLLTDRTPRRAGRRIVRSPRPTEPAPEML
jgi:hypothetical protein